MSKKEIFTLSPEGELVIETVGFDDSSCLEHAASTARAMEALGIRSQITDLQLKTPRPPEQTHSAKRRVEVGHD